MTSGAGHAVVMLFSPLLRGLPVCKPFVRSWNIMDFITSPFNESPFTMILLIGFV